MEFITKVLIAVTTCSVLLADDMKWMKWDRFDELDAYYNSIGGDNCLSKQPKDLLLRSDLVTQIPKFNELQNKVFYKNRTSLVHLHNLALNRAFFMSYTLQKLNTSGTFYFMPNIHYLYMSLTADVNANPSIVNGSAIYFDEDCYYPNWYLNMDFNKTLPFFGPKAYRWDDTFDTNNYLREPTLTTAFLTDFGSGQRRNYTSQMFKMNPWYTFWLPDKDASKDSTQKFSWGVNLKYSNGTGSFTHNEFQSFSFFGPNSAGVRDSDDKLPVRFTQPYFDCGGSDTWKVSAVSPIADFMPRYSNWTHLRRPRYVGVVSMEIEWDMIDFNACGVSNGNPGPSYLAGIHRCRPTTGCKHKSGYGFARGGYICHCKPGYRYPIDIQPPFQGNIIEQATLDEYNNDFQCTPIDYLNVLPSVVQTESVDVEFGAQGYNLIGRQRRSANISEHRPHDKYKYDANMKDNIKEKVHTKKKDHIKTKSKPSETKRSDRNKRSMFGRSNFDDPEYENMMRIFRKIAQVTRSNCKTMAPSGLILPADVAYGADSQFQTQGSMALRLSHFLSLYLQNVEEGDDFGGISGGGLLHYDLLFAEVLSTVMSDRNIYSCGIFFEPYMYKSQNESAREFFGPYAYKNKTSFYAVDKAGLKERYIDKSWYISVKDRWKINTEQLQTYTMRPMIRGDQNGTSQVRFEQFPITYKAPSYKQGQWVQPTFKCDGEVDAWVMTYTVPFFGKNKLTQRPRFAGVITVDIPLNQLEINQCPMPYYVPNAFKNTARCHFETMTCKPQSGFKFARGAYKCDCKQGYEYPFRDGKFWIEGSLLELEYEKKRRNLFSRFDTLKCRVAGSSNLKASWLLLFAVFVVKMFVSL